MIHFTDCRQYTAVGSIQKRSRFYQLLMQSAMEVCICHRYRYGVIHNPRGHLWEDGGFDQRLFCMNEVPRGGTRV